MAKTISPTSQTRPFLPWWLMMINVILGTLMLAGQHQCMTSGIDEED
jgi:hypothetical protein